MSAEGAEQGLLAENNRLLNLLKQKAEEQMPRRTARATSLILAGDGREEWFVQVASKTF